MSDPQATRILISADSHVYEPADLWEKHLPAALRSRLRPFSKDLLTGAQAHPGGHDPHVRLTAMAQDGVTGEILYPSLALEYFCLEDAELQAACFELYNDWLIEYCQVAPERLVGVPLIAAYDLPRAVAELERCAKAGLRGAMIWQSPPADRHFDTALYDPLWAAAQDLEMPVSLHILTGFDGTRLVYTKGRSDPEIYRMVEYKLAAVAGAMFDLIFSGALQRFPRLKFVLVEDEIGWLPFYLQQWDYYHIKRRLAPDLKLELAPSEFFKRQVYATFFDDHLGCRQLEWAGVDNYMWSSDFPHANSTWPHSREVIARDLGYLPAQAQRKLVCDNVQRLYGLNISSSMVE